ncbi:MAG: hypothetical protein ABIG68_11045 [Acidobacteriota bacterium]
MSYVSTRADSDTIWEGSLTIPFNAAPGLHNSRVEANADGVATDVPVGFDSPAPNSANTGYAVTGSYRLGVDRPD